MHANNQTNNNNNNSTSAIDLTYIYTLSIVKIKSIGNQTNSPKIRKDSCNHLRKLVLINTFIERKMAVYGEILKSKRSQQQQQQHHQHQQQQLVHPLPPLTPPPSSMNKHFVMSPQNVQHKQQQHQQQQHQQQQQQHQQQQQQHQQQQQSSQPRVKKSGYSYGGGFKRVQQQQKQQQRQKPFQVVQPIQVYSNQVPLVPQRTGFNLVQQPQIHWIPIQVPAHHHNNHNHHQMHYNYSMVQTQEQQLYLQQHVFLPPHPRGPHAPPLHLAKLVRRPQLVRM